MQPDKKFMQFKRFLADIAGSLVNTMKRPVGRPSLDAVKPPTRALSVQGDSTKILAKMALTICHNGTKSAKMLELQDRVFVYQLHEM